MCRQYITQYLHLYPCKAPEMPSDSNKGAGTTCSRRLTELQRQSVYHLLSSSADGVMDRTTYMQTISRIGKKLNYFLSLCISNMLTFDNWLTIYDKLPCIFIMKIRWLDSSLYVYFPQIINTGIVDGSISSMNIVNNTVTKILHTKIK